MTVTTTMLFGRPQHEIATLLSQRLSRANATSIVTGFATPGGVKAIAPALLAQPSKVDAFVIGAATYPAFEALDDLLAAGVPRDRLFVHLGHSHATGTHRNPFARYHPMLHSKVYFMELGNAEACAFIGSHNVTSFALGGLNGEAGVLLEGNSSESQFDDIRAHIAEAKRQAIQYTPDMKEAYAWWWREFIDGLRLEVHIPQDWSTVRTIMILCERAADHPRVGDTIYFEIPDGIEQIENLKTEVHLFLFNQLPSDPWTALSSATAATLRLKCITRGVDNRQGNQELRAEWRIQTTPTPGIHQVPGGTLRPNTGAGMQQVRAEVVDKELEEFDYVFERERAGWDPEYSADDRIEMSGPISDEVATAEANGVRNLTGSWQLVKGLSPRLGVAKELDQEALRLAAPDSGSFILVSLRRRRR
jgi:HKD family nuclease